MTKPRQGPLMPGEPVQLTDPKGRSHLITLRAGASFHTHRGTLNHDDIIGGPDGNVVRSQGGTPYVVFRPLLADFTLAMKRGAAVVHPKDAAQIVAFADVFPGARVLEAGGRAGGPSMTAGRRVPRAGRAGPARVPGAGGQARRRRAVPAGRAVRTATRISPPAAAQFIPSWPGPSMIARRAPRPARKRESERGRPAVDEALPEHV